jgi:hypothetical protein
MSKRKVISWKQMPARPWNWVWAAIILWMLLDRLRAPGWAWGAVGTILLLLLIGSLASWLSEEEFDVRFKDDD